MAAGIDYGMGLANIDPDTGIRYGVISQNSIDPEYLNDFEYDYGDPSCPDCGGSVLESTPPEEGKDFTCEPCLAAMHDDNVEDGRGAYWSSDCYPKEPIRIFYGADGYKITSCLDFDLMVLKSPFTTRARFCSPCVPGAGHLDSPDEDGVECYCLGADWFEDDVAPYPLKAVTEVTNESNEQA